MRWLLSAFAIILVLTTLYFGSAFYSVAKLASAVRAADGQAVLDRTDLDRVKRSLTDQILTAYLRKIGQTKKVSSIERVLVTTYGASVADAMLSKLLTGEGIEQILSRGVIALNNGSSAQVPALSTINITATEFFARLGFVQPTLLTFRTSASALPDNLSSIALHFDGGAWKLAGIQLPAAVATKLAESLPVN
jgi:DUF2939 family protein